MGHIRIKPNKKVDINFHPKELNNTPISEKSKEFISDYLKSKKLVANNEWNLLMMFEKEIVWGFVYIHLGEKQLLVGDS